METNPERTCQHCHQPVEFGNSERGYRDFVHTATGLSACPQPAAPRSN